MIIEHLETTRQISLDAHLTPEQRGTSLAWRRLIEDHYHQIFEHALFLQEGGTRRLKEFLRSMPWALRPILFRVLRSSLKKQLYARGVGRHDLDTIVAMGNADLDAIEGFLTKASHFAFGTQVSSLDATLFGFLATSIWLPAWGSPTLEYARQQPHIVA